MPKPIDTPNVGTTTKPERSSKRVAHKAPLGWLPWLALLLLALLIAGIVIALVAAHHHDKSDNKASTTTPTSSSTTTPGGGSGAASAVAAAAAGAVVGGAGSSPAPASASQAGLTGTRDPGTVGTVLFATGSSALDANAQDVIRTTAAHLKTAGVSSVEIVGYTDVVAGQPVNGALSQQRADAAAQALRAALPAVSVTTRADGEKNPIATNSTEEGRQQNRRAAIVARA